MSESLFAGANRCDCRLLPQHLPLQASQSLEQILKNMNAAIPASTTAATRLCSVEGNAPPSSEEARPGVDGAASDLLRFNWLSSAPAFAFIRVVLTWLSSAPALAFIRVVLTLLSSALA